MKIIPPLAPDFGNPRTFFRYIAGSAGTGKTWEAREEAKNDLHARLAATTGIAAVNLGDTTTIHSALGFYDDESAMESYTEGRMHSRVVNYARLGTYNWYIDEASMLGGKIFTCLVNTIVDVNDQLSLSSTYEGEPVTLTLIGDFAQLPPVNDVYAFERDEWAYFEGDNTVVLQEIRRQTDKDFVAALQAARRGEGSKALEYFEQFLVENKRYDFEGTTLVGINAKADRINALRIQDLPGEYWEYPTRREGRQIQGWDKIPDVLKLKEGTRVMVLVNRKMEESEEYLHVNGDVGIFVGGNREGARVLIERSGQEVSVLYNELAHKIPRTSPSGKRRYDSVGRVRYLPLRPAYATSVHKAQGLTLDQCQVSFSDWFFKSPGMLYVGLSRVRTPKGLTLVGLKDQFIARCRADEKVRRWL